MNDSNQRSSENGAVLIVAVMIMTAVVMFGLSALEYTTTVHATQNASVDRLQAQSLAEGALDLAFQRLAADSAFRGTIGPVNETGRSYRVDIRDVGTEIEIVATAVVGSTQATYTSRANEVAAGTESSETVESGRLLHTMGMGGKFSVQKSSADWTRKLAHSGELEVTAGGSYSGDTVHVPEFQPIAIDPTQFTPARVIGGSNDPLLPATITDLNYTGDILITGHVELDGETNVTGTILVEGDLGVSGDPSDDAIFNAPSGCALIVMGDLKLDKLGSVTVNGSVFALGDIQIQKTRFDGVGSVYVNDDIKFKVASGTWAYDPGPGSLVPPSVTIAPPTPIGGPIQELWRKPGR